MPRRRKNGADAVDVEPVEGKDESDTDRRENSAARAAIIRETCQAVAEFDRQIKGLKAERKAVIETRIVADLGMNKMHFANMLKLYEMDQGDRDELRDVIRECFAALGVGMQLNWLDAAETAGVEAG